MVTAKTEDENEKKDEEDEKNDSDDEKNDVDQDSDDEEEDKKDIWSKDCNPYMWFCGILYNICDYFITKWQVLSPINCCASLYSFQQYSLK